ncbi:type IV pilus biogenesis/stability protein PilW [Spongiibacter sp. KMU-158]|uniref:Type IV pilus biogenesis/stability protein PilW n=1 Tax=Spongiibacter pelagi TaxID=2760804 RepID=A0A927BZ68_9GAMM|nr:type IV pilus biogenesis/stability protein PilW [Spongiibacter pelagi]MBD2858284.1 type IV pilus biogenesis/stability protein PilW [Spongiibacter pelagi]
MRNAQAPLRQLAIVVLLTLMSGCVTTQTGGFAAKADEEKAYETSLQLARAYIASGQWDQAKRHLQYAESVEKNNPETLEALALVFQNTGEIEIADQYYSRAVASAPKQMRIRNNYGAFLYSQGRYQAAASQLEVVATDLLYERRVEAFINLGRCYLKLDRLQDAENTFRRAYLMDQKSPLVLSSMAEVTYLNRNYPQSQGFYDAYRAQVPQQTAASLWLGIRLAWEFGDQDAASSYALALKNLYPKSEEYLLYRQSQQPR